jgi:hypothetical protein
MASARAASSLKASSDRSDEPIEAERRPTKTRRPICSLSERSTSSSLPKRTETRRGIGDIDRVGVSAPALRAFDQGLCPFLSLKRGKHGFWRSS